MGDAGRKRIDLSIGAGHDGHVVGDRAIQGVQGRDQRFRVAVGPQRQVAECAGRHHRRIEDIRLRRGGFAMKRSSTHSSRRDFLGSASAAMIATFAAPAILHAASPTSSRRSLVLVGSHGDDGIQFYDWDRESGTLTRSGVAAKIPQVAWLAFSHGHDFVYSASELDSFQGKPTGEVASFRLAGAELQPLSARNSAGTGTCHVAPDATGRMLLAADYTGASAASFRIQDGKLSEPCGPSTTPCTAPIPIDSKPRTRTSRPSRPTTASPISMTWAAIASTSTSPTLTLRKCRPPEPITVHPVPVSGQGATSIGRSVRPTRCPTRSAKSEDLTSNGTPLSG